MTDHAEEMRNKTSLVKDTMDKQKNRINSAKYLSYVYK